MTEEETKNILNLIYTTYPHSFKDWTKTQFTFYRTVWLGCFANIPPQFVQRAVIQHIAKSTSDFAPKPGQIRAEIMEMLAPDIELEAMDSWESVRRYIRRRTGEKELDLPEYNKLSETSKRIFTMDDLRNISLLSSHEIEGRRIEFIKLYKTLRNKENEELLTQGKLITLAGGKKRYMSLGYNPNDSNS